jgi:small-conductance mechanosensitive channel
MGNWLEIIGGNPTSSWLTAGYIFVSIVAIFIVARFIAARYLTAFAAKTNTHFDDIMLLLVKKINLAIVVLVALFLAQKALGLPEKLVQLLRIAAVSGVFLQIGLWGNAVVSFFLGESMRKAGQQDVNISARRAMAFLGRLALWSLVLALLLENLGVRLSPLLAGMGIGGIAIALAIQNILGDLFCYVAIVLDKPFIAGDFVIVGDMMGTIERIGMKTTRIRSLSGELLIFANHDLVNSRIRNYKSLQERRILFRFGVTYETPSEKLKKIPSLVRHIFDSISKARLDRIHFVELGDFSLNFEVVYYVLSADYAVYMDTQQAVNLSLMEEIGKEGIDFAYPTQSIYVQNVRPKNER